MRGNAAAFRTTAALFVVAVVLNYPWEMAQAFLFAPMGSIAQAVGVVSSPAWAMAS